MQGAISQPRLMLVQYQYCLSPPPSSQGHVMLLHDVRVGACSKSRCLFRPFKKIMHTKRVRYFIPKIFETCSCVENPATHAP